MKIPRDPADDKKLLTEQYQRLKSAVDGFYEGREFEVLNIAITLRVLIHETDKSHSLLSRVNPGYWDLDIYHKPLNPRTLFTVPVTLRIRGDGDSRIIRSSFDSPSYKLVPLLEWWTAPYQAPSLFKPIRLSKKDIILNVAHKDGGAHVDSEVPETHHGVTRPPFQFGMDNGGEKILLQPNLAYGITAVAGHEMQDYLERHFFQFVAGHR
jgi:hypothetical protein